MTISLDRDRPDRTGRPPEPFDLALMLEVLAQPTSPFHEQNVAALAVDTARDIGWHVQADAVGNLLLTPEARTRPELVLTAHMDHPGFWALGPSDRGRGHLLAQWMGRVPAEAMIDQPVRFWIAGQPIIDRLPGVWSDPRFTGKLGGRAVGGWLRSILDTNELDNPNLVEIEIEGEVEPGSIGMWRLDEPCLVGRQVHAPAIDDLAAVATLLIVARRLSLAGERPAVGILLTRAEEGGFFGAIDYARRHPGREHAPLHVGLEMSMARGDVAVGSGAVLRVGDRRTTFSPRVAAWETRVAEKLAASDPDFRHQRQLMPGGSCESTVFEAWFGRAGAICLPLGNYHNVTPSGGLGSEFIDLHDFRDLVELCLGLIRSPFRDEDQLAGFAAWWSEYADRHQHLYGSAHAAASEPVTSEPVKAPAARSPR